MLDDMGLSARVDLIVSLGVTLLAARGVAPVLVSGIGRDGRSGGTEHVGRSPGLARSFVPSDTGCPDWTTSGIP